MLEYLSLLCTILATARCKQEENVRLFHFLVLVYFGRKFLLVVKWKKLWQVVDIKKRKVAAQKKQYGRKYPSVSANQAEIVALDFGELTKRLQSRELSATQVLHAFYAKAVEVDKATNAVTEFIDEALKEARTLDAQPREGQGPLHGLPVSLKEHIFLTGKSCTAGISDNLKNTCSKDAEIVVALKRLGAIPFCRTNLPQACISFDCSNPIHGKTANPGSLLRGPGGSSGGEGALIAGGGSVIGIGSDLGGSVRMPAHICGISALKPTSGRLPQSGQVLDGGLYGVVGIFNTLGFMAKSASNIKDCMKIFLDKSNVQKITNDARFVPIAWDDTKAKMGQTLRIGWYNYDGCFEATPGVRRAVTTAVTLLRNKGHQVVPFKPPNLAKVYQMFGLFKSADEGRSIKGMLSNSLVDRESLGIWWIINSFPFWLQRMLAPLIAIKSPIIANLMSSNGRAKKSWKLWELNKTRLELVEEILREWSQEQIDVVIAPAMGVPAQPSGTAPWIPNANSYTSVYNVLDFPAGSVPVNVESSEDQTSLKSYPGFEKDLVYGWAKEGTKGAEGMPLSVQIIGRPWSEELVLRAMVELEESAAAISRP